MLVERAVRGSRGHAALGLHEHDVAVHGRKGMVERIAHAREASAAAMQEKRHVGTQASCCFLDTRIVGRHAPQVRSAQQRRGGVRGAAAQPGLGGAVLLEAGDHRLVSRAFQFFSQQAHGLRHDVALHGHIEHREPFARNAREIDG